MQWHVHSWFIIFNARNDLNFLMDGRTCLTAIKLRQAHHRNSIYVPITVTEYESMWRQVGSGHANSMGFEQK